MPGRPTRPSRHKFLPRQLYCVRQHNRPLGWERGVMGEHDTARTASEGRSVGIERTEYYARQAAARELAQERGFSALVAWARGASRRLASAAPPTRTTKSSPT